MNILRSLNDNLWPRIDEIRGRMTELRSELRTLRAEEAKLVGIAEDAEIARRPDYEIEETRD